MAALALAAEVAGTLKGAVEGGAAWAVGVEREGSRFWAWLGLLETFKRSNVTTLSEWRSTWGGCGEGDRRRRWAATARDSVP